jgi:hypothetical protein
MCPSRFHISHWPWCSKLFSVRVLYATNCSLSVPIFCETEIVIIINVWGLKSVRMEEMIQEFRQK